MKSLGPLGPWGYCPLTVGPLYNVLCPPGQELALLTFAPDVCGCHNSGSGLSLWRPLPTQPHLGSVWCYRFPLILWHLHYGGVYNRLIALNSTVYCFHSGAAGISGSFPSYIQTVSEAGKPCTRAAFLFLFFLLNYTVPLHLLWFDFLLIDRLIIKFQRGSQTRGAHCPQRLVIFSSCLSPHLILLYPTSYYLFSHLFLTSLKIPGIGKE